jgi:hypothetical protein
MRPFIGRSRTAGRRASSNLSGDRHAADCGGSKKPNDEPVDLTIVEQPEHDGHGDQRANRRVQKEQGRFVVDLHGAGRQPLLPRIRPLATRISRTARIASPMIVPVNAPSARGDCRPDPRENHCPPPSGPRRIVGDMCGHGLAAVSASSRSQGSWDLSVRLQAPQPVERMFTDRVCPGQRRSHSGSSRPSCLTRASAVRHDPELTALIS